MTFASNGAEHKTSSVALVYSRFISSRGIHRDFNKILEARLQRFIEVWRNKVEWEQKTALLYLLYGCFCQPSY